MFFFLKYNFTEIFFKIIKLNKNQYKLIVFQFKKLF